MPLKQRHDHKAHVTSPAENDRGSGSSSSQQAAAAWAWLQHGGGTCITPRRAEGLMAANLSAKHKLARPSRFRLELKRNTAIPDQHSETAVAEHAAAKGPARRRHSFHDTPARRPTVDSFSLGRSTTAAASATWPAQQLGAADHDHDAIKGYYVHQDDEVSSLLDKFELEAVWRQLVEISAPSSKMERPGCAVKAQKAVNPPAVQLKTHRRHLYRSADDLSTHKSSAGGMWRGLSARFLHHHHHPHHNDDHHGHHFGHGAADLLHNLLHLRITTSSRSPMPFCSSIATVNSIADHHQSVSPKKFRAHVHHVSLQEPPQYDLDTADHEQIGRVRSKHSGKKLNRPSQGINLTVLEPADEGIAANQQAPGRHSYSKVLQSLIHRLPHISSHISHESPSKVTRTNHHHLHNHHHFHHHYHHHHLQRHAADAVLVNHLTGSDASAVQERKQYCLQNDGSPQFAGCPLQYISEDGCGLHPAEGRKSPEASSKADDHHAEYMQVPSLLYKAQNTLHY